MTSRESEKLCCLCGDENEQWPGGYGYGNNAEPVAAGRCCDACNQTRVIPARRAEMAAGKWFSVL